MIEKKIISLANNLSNYGIKSNSKNIVTKKNRICGYKIKMNVEVKNNLIVRVNYETNSCIFCQASASLLAKYMKKKKLSELNYILSLPNYRFLLSKKYQSRRECVMLPIEALIKATKN